MPGCSRCWRHRLDRKVGSSRRISEKHGYKQIDFGNENAMEKLLRRGARGQAGELSRC